MPRYGPKVPCEVWDGEGFTTHEIYEDLNHPGTYYFLEGVDGRETAVVLNIAEKRFELKELKNQKR